MAADPQMQEGLLELSRRLLMNDLKVEVEKIILQTLSKDSFEQICDLAEDYESQVLAEQCLGHTCRLNSQYVPQAKD